MKKESDLSRLMSCAGRHKAFTYASWVLSAVSALMALVPFLYIWMILRDVLNAAPDYSKAVNIPYYGWMAVLFAVLAMLIYIAGLMCSHLSAFRVATNLRLTMTRHIATLPLGAIAVRRDVPVELARAIEAAITASVDYANANPRASADFIREHAQELAESVTSAHIRTFVTEYSRDLGDTGRQAIARLVETAARMQGLRLPEAGLFL